MDQSIKRIFRQGSLLCIICLALACEKAEVEPDPNGNNNGNNGGNNSNNGILTPDEFSNLLVLENAARKQGAVPTGPNGNLLLDVKDTVFILKGFAFGNRVRIKHDPNHEIKGVYIHVPGTDHYYDAPISEDFGGEDTDSVSAFFLNVDPEVEVECFFAMEVWFRPYDQSGNVIDEFVRIVSIEESCDNSCAITGETEVCNPSTGLCKTGPKWDWEFTYFTKYSGEITGFNAPFLYTPGGYETGGCCVNGNSFYNPATCGSRNPNFKKLYVNNQYLASISETLRFDDNGKFFRTTLDAENSYNPDKSDFCNGIPGYDFSFLDYEYSGNYTYQSENVVNLDYTDYPITTDPDFYGIPVGWYNHGGEIVSSCHRLILKRSDNETGWFIRVYKQYMGDSWFE